MAEKEQWITVNGKHILIKDGESKKEAISKAFEDNRDKFDPDEDDNIKEREDAIDSLIKENEERHAREDDFYSPDNIIKRHQKIEDGFEMPKEEGWEPSDFGEKSFIKNKNKDNEMFIQYNGSDYDGDNQEWVAGYMKNGEYVNKKFGSMEEAKEFLDNADLEKETQEAFDKSDYVINDKGQAVPRKYDEKYGNRKSVEDGAKYLAPEEIGIDYDNPEASIRYYEKKNNVKLYEQPNGSFKVVPNKDNKLQEQEEIKEYKSKYKPEDFEDARYYPVSEEDKKAAGPRYLGRYHSIFNAHGLDDNVPGSWKKERDMFKYVGDSKSGASIVQGPDGYYSGNPRINSMSFKTKEAAADYLDRKNPEEHKYGIYFKPGDETEYMYRDAEDKYDLEAPDAYKNARNKPQDQIVNKSVTGTERFNELKEKVSKLSEAEKEMLKDLLNNPRN